MKVVMLLALSILVLALVAWAGLRVRPQPLPDFIGPAGAPEMLALPSDLAPAVARYYETLYGDALPVHTSVVFSGRGSMTIRGVTFSRPVPLHARRPDRLTATTSS